MFFFVATLLEMKRATVAVCCQIDLVDGAPADEAESSATTENIEVSSDEVRERQAADNQARNVCLGEER